VIKEINTQRSGNVAITTMSEKKLSDAAATLIGSRPVFDISVGYQKSGKTEYIRAGDLLSQHPLGLPRSL